MNKIPMLERFAAQSLVEHDGELIFSKEKFAELIVRECIDIAYEYDAPKMSGPGMIIGNRIEEHFGVTE
jgi:hypothetical protein